MKVSRVLIVAGSDSGGGAGIQADIKAVTMMGGHAMTAITAQRFSGDAGSWRAAMAAEISAAQPLRSAMLVGSKRLAIARPSRSPA